MFDVNLPHLTDAGAVALGEGLARAARSLGTAVRRSVPSQATSLAGVGGVVLLGFGWLAFAFYRESRSKAAHHTHEHHPRPAPAT